MNGVFDVVEEHGVLATAYRLKPVGLTHDEAVAKATAHMGDPAGKRRWFALHVVPSGHGIDRSVLTLRGEA